MQTNHAQSHHLTHPLQSPIPPPPQATPSTPITPNTIGTTSATLPQLLKWIPARADAYCPDRFPNSLGINRITKVRTQFFFCFRSKAETPSPQPPLFLSGFGRRGAEKAVAWPWSRERGKRCDPAMYADMSKFRRRG